MRFAGPRDTFYVGRVPVVVTTEISVGLDASVRAGSRIKTGLTSSLVARDGAGWTRSRGFYALDHVTRRFTDPHASVSADSTVRAMLTPRITVFIDGVPGPRVNLSTGLNLVADTSTNPWWTLSAPVTAAARLAIPALAITDHAPARWRRVFTVASAGQPFPATGGPGASASTTPPPAVTTPPLPAAQPPTLPAAGPTLVDVESTAGDAAAGDESFTDWSRATARSAIVVGALPSDLSGYRCVVLDLNQAFAVADESELAGFLGAGGTIVALGERSDNGGQYTRADNAINGMLSSLGAGLRLGEAAIDEGDTITTNIDPSPFTDHVSDFGYNWATTVALSGSARALIATADGSGTLVGEQSVNGGTVVVSGDSNAFSDNNDGFYIDDNNGQLVNDICP